MRTLSVIVPVFNEAPHLEKVLRHLFSAPCQLEREWIILDDCSTDASSEILESLKDELGFRFVRMEKNVGKGAAIRHGITLATGSLIMIQDADFEYDPTDVPELLRPLLENKADVVYGSRFKKSALQVHRTYHYFINRLLTVLSNLFSGVYLTDMETCYKIFEADLLKSMQLKSNRFGVEVELTAYIAKTSARIFEVPIHYYPRTQLQGKKISWKDGFAALWHLVYFNFFVNQDAAFKDLPRAYQTGGLRTPYFVR